MTINEALNWLENKGVQVAIHEAHAGLPDDHYDLLFQGRRACRDRTDVMAFAAQGFDHWLGQLPSREEAESIR